MDPTPAPRDVPASRDVIDPIRVRRQRRRSPTGGVVLIIIGLFFLPLKFHPEFEPWPIIARYWPVILIVIGVGKIWDAWLYRQNPGAPPAAHHSGMWVALAILLVFSSASRSGKDAPAITCATRPNPSTATVPTPSVPTSRFRPAP